MLADLGVAFFDRVEVLIFNARGREFVDVENSILTGRKKKLGSGSEGECRTYASELSHDFRVHPCLFSECL